MGNIYDGAFRTILNDCRQMIIPVINEIFKEDYTGNEIIEFHPNEHFIDQQDAADKERITDTNLIIYGKKKKKYHLECESSLPDGRMTIRLFEYDALRNYKKTPDKMRYVIKTPGGTVEYDVPIMKVQEYTLEDIFSKGLLLLIPFYIFSHEKNFKVYNNNEQRLAELKAEYRNILERLDKLEQEGIIGAFDKCTIIELSGDVIREIAQKYEKVQKGIGAMMSGALLETEARTILNRGKDEAKKETALRMLMDGELSIDKIAKYSGLDVAEVELLTGMQ
ncbi:MAG: hypothetical protein HFI50_10425 [Lachnospiraceae bacterium]|nr:hypothetical protein [Lachnospiraceae bacterium]